MRLKVIKKLVDINILYSSQEANLKPPLFYQQG